MAHPSPIASTRRQRQRRRAGSRSCPQPRSRSTAWPESRSLQILDRAPANDAPIGGIKVVSADGWFAARPSGTENIYKIYAESFRDEDALKQILVEAQTIVDAAIADPR